MTQQMLDVWKKLITQMVSSLILAQIGLNTSNNNKINK